MIDTAAQSQALADLHSRVILELQLDSTKATKGIDQVRERIEGGGGRKKSKSGGGAQDYLSGLASEAGGALLGEAGIGAGLSYVANYGLTTLSNLPGAKYWNNAGALRDIGSTFQGNVNASENYLGVTNKFAASGIALDPSIKRELADRSLAQQQFLQRDQQQSKDIFAKEAGGENGITMGEPKNELVDALNGLTDAIKAVKGFFGIGDAKR